MDGEAEHDLLLALRQVGLRASAGAGAEADVVIDLDGRRIAVEVKALATALPEQVTRLVTTPARRQEVAHVLVADRVVATARERLRAAGWGWLDRRGHLRLEAPGVLIDSPVDLGATSVGKPPPDPFGGQVGREVAAALLVDGPPWPGVRDLAQGLGRAPSSVSRALTGLRAEGLVGVDNRPVIPELFWELAAHWQTPRQSLTSEPRPGDSALTRQLALGLEDVTGSVGWALTDTVAAAAYGAPVAVQSGEPRDFVVPSPGIVRRATLTLGISSPEERSCTVRVAPVGMMCSRRIDGPSFGINESWPLAHPIFVALDLAADPGRGSEILQGWKPQEPWRRVW